MYKRLFKLPSGQKSFFLFGPRQTGKSTLIDSLLKDKTVLKFDFLEPQTALRYKTHPDLFQKEVERFIQGATQPIIFIDEVQKVSEVLDSIHLLLYRYPHTQFIMTGSSARKLKRGGANLLAGRALEYHLHPLTFLELGDRFELDTQLGQGSLPPFVGISLNDCEEYLRAYTGTYLKQEILDEALVRKIAPFNRFLELAADQNGELINYSNIARDVGVASKTIQDYYQILEDTLICLRLFPYMKRAKRRLIHQPRYYFFDLGVTNSLCRRAVTPAIPGTSLYGRQFEHFVFLELQRLTHYQGKPFSFFHWRDTTGNEVDLIIEDRDCLIACEIKAKDHIFLQDLKGLRKFAEDYPDAELKCISLTPRSYTLPYGNRVIDIIPWMEFLNNLFL